MKLIKRLLKYATPIHHYIPEYLIYTLLGIIFGLINFTMLIPMLNIMFGMEKALEPVARPAFELSINYFVSLFNYYFVHIISTRGNIYALGFVCVIILAATVLSNLFRYLSVRVLIRLRLNVMERLRNDLYTKLTNQSLAYYHIRTKGSILSTITNEVQEIESSLINALQVWLKDPFIVIIYFSILFYISPSLTLFTILFLPVSGLLIASVTGKLRKLSYFNFDQLGKITSHLEETISGIRIVQSFAAENYAIGKFRKMNQEFSRTSRDMFNRKELTSPLSEMLGIIVVVTIVMYGGYLLTTNQSPLTGSLFLTYLALYSQIIQPLKNISNASSNIQKGIVASESIFAMLDEPIRIKETESASTKQNFSHSIELRNVHFRYGSSEVLTNINLNIEKGKTIALVGESGAGKSTLADLIPRFYDVTDGSIEIDGKDLRDFKLSDLRSLIGMVTQEAILFNDSVLANISFGDPNADRERAEAAAKAANAHNFIMELEQGYDTSIGDRGLRLSGGQRQRLTIARAIYKNAPILIMDEATSALDTESERLVQDAVDRMMENRTSIVIAHRLSTIRHADEIIVLRKGEIIERGKHEELMARTGYYRKLVEMQAS